MAPAQIIKPKKFLFLMRKKLTGLQMGQICATNFSRIINLTYASKTYQKITGVILGLFEKMGIQYKT